MIVVIFITTLITFVILVVSSVSYLISLVCNESDDSSSLDTLPIEFQQSLSVSPDLSSFGAICTNPRHHHHYDDIKPANPPRGSTSSLDSNKVEAYPGAIDGSASNHSISTVSPESIGMESELSFSSALQQDAPAQNAWSAASAKEQKNIITSQIGAPASKHLFDDFDTREMQLGGTGLHWCKSRKSLDKLIRIGLPLDSRNNKQETAVHVAIRRKKLPVLIGLLIHGAKIDCKDEHGQTPLILASKMADIYACQVLLVYDADVNQLDDSKWSARHYISIICEKNRAQPQMPNAAHVILAMFDELGAKRCPKEVVQDASQVTGNTKICAVGCAASGTYNGNSYNRWPNFQMESLYKRHMFTDIIEQQRASLRSNHENDTGLEKSRILCIDGGGMRGVIVCQILIELEKYLKKPVISYFDWIGGTSVGAFISCSLCRGISLKDLRRICFDVKDEVFSGNKPYNSKFLERVLKRTFGPATRMSDVTDKKLAVTTVLADREPCQLRLFRNYKSAGQLLKEYGYPPDTFDRNSAQSTVTRRKTSATSRPKLQQGSTKLVPRDTPQVSAIRNDSEVGGTVANKTTVNSNKGEESTKTTTMTATSANKEDSKSDSLTDYVIDENEQDPLIWQAVRASAAAPFFFKPYGPYLDGGIISNNPTVDMLSEFHCHERVKSFLRARANTDSSLASQRENISLFEEPPRVLGLVLSLGTGRGRVISRQAMLDFGQVTSGFATVFSPVELLRSIRAARDLFKKVMQQSCHTEDHVLDRAQAWCSSLGVPYFRINPPLATLFSIDDKRDEQLINALWQAKLYMRVMRPQLEEISQLLDHPQEVPVSERSASVATSSSDNVYGNFSDLDEASCNTSTDFGSATSRVSSISAVSTSNGIDRDVWSPSNSES